MNVIRIFLSAAWIAAIAAVAAGPAPLRFFDSSGRELVEADCS
jgi:hypothetical protein